MSGPRSVIGSLEFLQRAFAQSDREKLMLSKQNDLLQAELKRLKGLLADSQREKAGLESRLQAMAANVPLVQQRYMCYFTLSAQRQ
ncbi:hypothetical protein KIPB_009055 [Kipferlia bialata]|uniref:Uncharacterized protein n=1 Tax=Kipferlia bialata TaxID=797122 RepID=A0A9K3D3S4_9EUKA|nr:hypothetical protein KIPB_009055 [Kipferlia bialata]|eukprot:g9055.t1